jgi:hypothetical protein
VKDFQHGFWAGFLTALMTITIALSIAAHP